MLTDKFDILRLYGSESNNISIEQELFLVRVAEPIIENKFIESIIQDNIENDKISVGYTIKNIGNDPINEIYYYKNKKVQTKTLLPNETMNIQNIYLMLLLFRPEYCLKVYKNELNAINNPEQVNDLDDFLLNYTFEQPIKSNIIGLINSDNSIFQINGYKDIDCIIKNSLKNIEEVINKLKSKDILDLLTK